MSILLITETQSIARLQNIAKCIIHFIYEIVTGDANPNSEEMFSWVERLYLFWLICG